MALDNLPVGVSDYELRFINYSTGDSTHSTSTVHVHVHVHVHVNVHVNVNAGLAVQDTTPPLASGYNGVTNFGIEGYVRSSPGSYRIALVDEGIAG